MGAAGAPFALYLSFIEPTSVFNLNYAVSALAMPIIGGMSHWIGPVIGAVLLGTVQQLVTVTISSELNVLVVGRAAGGVRRRRAGRDPRPRAEAPAPEGGIGSGGAGMTAKRCSPCNPCRSTSAASPRCLR